jgi:ubiquinone/menaquinone biosynthesis C-methylase UbiE/uncharacterized protein YbaR (Trm112 family)
MNEWLLRHLVCPRDRQSLELSAAGLVCAQGHRYPVINDVPVMLLDDSDVTHHYIKRTLEQVAGHHMVQQPVEHVEVGSDRIDDFVQREVPYTSGNLYFPVQHKLTRYPIPFIRLPQGHGRRLLDVGCNWGRWSIAAAGRGYRPVGLDPSLDAVLAARRVARQLGADADFVVGDARFLPFDDSAFDTVFTYGVLQHFSKDNARMSLREIRRVLRPDGMTLIQMPNKYGIRQYQQHRRRGFTEGEKFQVRYWTPAELMETFRTILGPTTMTTDCYFGLGIQPSDVDLMPMHYRMIIGASEVLRKLSHLVPPLTRVADSLYLESVNQKTTG